MLRKLLVANRGEIALRILRAARERGLRTVAVFSAADAGAPHATAADEALCIGPAAARDSYLCIDRLLEAAARVGADALHPGYGFLAENAELAERCAEAGVCFVGPPAAAIRAMGDKAAAKRRLRAAGIPVIPGYDGAAQDEATLTREAERLGFPLLVKAAAGGGGRGMRIVRDPAQLPAALTDARAEAEGAFGDGALLLETLLEGARHVEIQVLADGHGNAVHLGERECSAQRRHQKVIEEAPSPAVDEALREAMGRAAVRAAEAIGYVGAGTVEFMLSFKKEFYFLEMNTRLQVEHPVTELVTGLDLVALQLAVAEGEALPFGQDDVTWRGHAIEARVYAEDPAAGFLPQAGEILAWRPAAGPGVRVDAGVASGQRVSADYDPLLAKIIAWGETRELARRRLAAAVEGTALLGLPSNRPLLVALLEDPAFVAGEVDTATLDRWIAEGRFAPGAVPDALWALGAVLASVGAGDVDPWRSSGAARWPVTLERGADRRQLEVAADPAAPGPWQRFTVAVAGAEPLAVALPAARPAAGRLRCELDGVQRWAEVARRGRELHLELPGLGAAVFVEPSALRAESDRPAAAGGDVLAPIGGRVVAVEVAAGDRVAAGQCLVVIEAMKMEHRVCASGAGVVERVAVAVDDQVAARQLVAAIAAEPDQGA